MSALLYFCVDLIACKLDCNYSDLQKLTFLQLTVILLIYVMTFCDVIVVVYGATVTAVV